MFDSTEHKDILLVGSSRIFNFLDPEILDSTLGMSTYNAGMPGSHIFENNMVMKAFIAAHGMPKIVIISVDLNSMEATHYVRAIPPYLPYTNNNIIKEGLRRSSINVNMMNIFPFLKVIELDDFYKGGILKKTLGVKDEIPRGDYFREGFLSNGRDTVRERKDSIISKYQVVDEKYVTVLKNMITFCKSNNATVILTYAPEYKFWLQKSIKNSDSILNLYGRIANFYKIPFLRNDSLDMNNDAKLFAYAAHVNTEGAKVYSKIFAEQLKLILQSVKQQ